MRQKISYNFKHSSAEYREFFKFLKENNISVFSFFRNVSRDMQVYCKQFPREYVINKYLRECDDNFSGLINWAFLWAGTKEGSDYWINISEKWQAHFKSYKFVMS